MTELLLGESAGRAPAGLAMPMRLDMAPPEADRVIRAPSPMVPLLRLARVLFGAFAVASVFWPLGLLWLL